jgi:hypothetical protein
MILTVYAEEILLRPILAYAAPVLGIAACSYIENLLCFQNKCLKMISDLQRMMATKTWHRDLT